ncbi:MAG TPA: CHC2 zinc finger domain-containing protein [Kofleriaceae bacterium]|nr:CHC2 zinc finger domain-containing protein [Kofleriaceae bacterium]
MTALDAFKAFVEEVRSRCNLVELIGRDVDLRRVGSVYKGLSPFRAEKHASLVVWPETQTWHDFSAGGGAGGDVFSYVQEREKVGFKEAVRLLAERTGVRPPDQDEASWQRALRQSGELRAIERLLSLAAAYYHQQLPAPLREQYFHQRYGFSDETIDELKLGWADGGLFQHMTQAGVPRRAALATGLFVPRKDKVVDFFQHRLVFPYWRGGNVVYFTARATDLTPDEPWEKPKYKKLRARTKEAPYISETVKNDYFFNEDAARGAHELVITEGTPDCISARQCGVACISTGTTSFRAQDLPRLLRIARDANRIVICNDAEISGAGEAAARALAQQLWQLGREACIASIPRAPDVAKVDLNDLVIAGGADALRAVLAAALPYPEYLLAQIPADTPPNQIDARLHPVLAAIGTCSSIRADVVLDAIVKKFGIRRRALLAAIKQHAVSREVPATSDVAMSPPPPPPPPSSSNASGGSAAPPKRLPQIQVNGRQLRDVVADAWSALHAANTGPQAFLRAGQLVRVARGDAFVHLAPLSEAETYGLAAQVVDWVRVTQSGVIDVLPLKEAVRDMFVRPDLALPPLEAVVSTPFFDEDGTLVSTPGYHRAARVWYLEDGLRIAPISQAPTLEEIAAARTLIFEHLLVDFPFTAESDRTHAVAAILLPFARRLIPDCTPIHLLEAPSPGSGKGLLADLISMLVLGHAAVPATLTADEDETRKKITSLLMQAQPVILLDNIKDVLDSAQLAAALTAEVWSDRLLGHSRLIQLPNRATWIATGNNLQLSMEIARRCVRVRIDAKVDQPWLRTGFRHDPLKPWVSAHRPDLVRALLVLIQAWIAAGRPRGTRTLGSFDAWARTMGGILEHASMPGFLADTNELYESADSETQEWRDFTSAWWERFRSLWVNTNELVTLALNQGLLPSLLANRDLLGQKVRLGKALSKARDRHFGHYRIVVGRNSHIKAAHYQLVDVGEPPTGATTAENPGRPVEP